MFHSMQLNLRIKRKAGLVIFVLCISALCTGLFVAHENATHFRASSWTFKQVTAPLNSSEARLSNVSCTSPTFCVAAGSFSTSLNGDFYAFMSVFDGTNWSARQAETYLNTGPSAIKSVSCTSPTFCVAVGYFTDTSSKQEGFISIYNGAVWQDSRFVFPTSITNFYDPTGEEINSVSCTSTTFCVAAGRYFTDQDEVAFVSVYNGTTWEVSDQGPPSTWSSSDAVSVSCTSLTFCAAIGEYFYSTYLYRQFVSTFNGKLWDYKEFTLPIGSSSMLSKISCTSSIFCVAGGSYFSDKSSGNTPDAVFLSFFNGSKWVAKQIKLPRTHGPGINSVSCTSSTFCVASIRFDTNDAPPTVGHVSVVYDGTKLTSMLSKGKSTFTDPPYAVSCTTAKFCAEYGGHSNFVIFTNKYF